MIQYINKKFHTREHYKVNQKFSTSALYYMHKVKQNSIFWYYKINVEDNNLEGKEGLKDTSWRRMSDRLRMLDKLFFILNFALYIVGNSWMQKFIKLFFLLKIIWKQLFCMEWADSAVYLTFSYTLIKWTVEFLLTSEITLE